MTIIHSATRTGLGLSASAPAAVTTYSFQLQPAGSPIAVTQVAIDGTNGNDTIAAGSNVQYVFGFDGNDRLSNQGSAAALLGGNGADTFVMYNNVNFAGLVDGILLDFEVGTDLLDISNFGVTSFSQLVITPNTTGTPGSFVQITSAVNNLSLNISATGGLNNLNASSFVFSGGSTPTTPTTPTTPLVPSTPSFTVPGFSLPDLAALFTVTGLNTIGTAAGTTISGGALADLIYGALLTDTLDGGDTVSGGAGADRLYGAYGNDLLYGGASQTDPNDGNDTVYGGTGSDKLYGNGGNDILIGGNSLYDAADSGDTLVGGAGNDQLYGNGGDDRLYGLTGDDTLVGGAGNDSYYFATSGGDDVVVGFEGAGAATGDTLAFLSGVFATAQAAISAVSYSGGAAQFNLGNGDTVTLLNVAANSLTTADITIVNDFTFA